MDFYFSAEGDIKISSNGDIALTDTDWRDDAQQAYIRLKTEPGDWTLYTHLGADLASLYGMPQSLETGNLGIKLIQTALNRGGRFVGRSIEVKAVPTSIQTIRFDIYIKSGERNALVMSIEQDLGVN
jgi:hypothetical protein